MMDDLGKLLYTHWIEANRTIQNCSVDSWDGLPEEDKQVWRETANLFARDMDVD